MAARSTGRISLFRPLIREESIDAVSAVLRSGWLGLGPKTREFEEAFATYVGSPYCVGVSSGTAALTLALRVLDLPPGSDVVTTPLTFVASNQVILAEGLRPVFADVQPETGNLDVGSVAERITPRTAAILLMHYGGYPCDLAELYGLARERGIPVVEDCAHACGAVYQGGRIGSHGDLHAFSFHAVKNLPMGDGGALTVRSPEHDARMRSLRWFGISSDTYTRSSGRSYRWDYQVQELGMKCHMNDVQAALGLGQLPHLEEEIERRAQIADRYRNGFADVPGLELLHEESDRSSSYHLFCVLAERRDDLIDKLAHDGIEASVHYRPSYHYSMFDGEPLPVVESFWTRALSLPMHLCLTDDQVDAIVDAVREGW